jgi:hypothetical protein
MAKRKVLHRHENGSDMNIVGLDRFFTRQNVALYRTLADKRTSAAKRKEILQLLARSKSNSGQISRGLRRTQIRCDLSS